MHHDQSILHCDRYIRHHNLCIMMTGHKLVSLCFIFPDFVSLTSLSLHCHVPCSVRVKPLHTHTLVFGRAVRTFIFISFYTVLVHVPCSIRVRPLDIFTLAFGKAVHARSLINCHPIEPSIMYHSINCHMCPL